MKRIYLHLAIILMICFCQCATSRITGTWKGKEIHPENYKTILVMAVIHGPDSSLQATMEKHMVRQLTTHGFTALSACIKYGPRAFVTISKDSIKKILSRDSIDVVLTIVLRDKSKEVYDVTGRFVLSLYPFRENDFWMYYSAMNDYPPVYTNYTEHTAWFWESNVYDVSNGALVYAIQTASFDPFSEEDLSGSYANLLVKELLRKKIFQPHKYH